MAESIRASPSVVAERATRRRTTSPRRRRARRRLGARPVPSSGPRRHPRRRRAPRPRPSCRRATARLRARLPTQSRFLRGPARERLNDRRLVPGDDQAVREKGHGAGSRLDLRAGGRGGGSSRLPGRLHDASPAGRGRGEFRGVERPSNAANPRPARLLSESRRRRRGRRPASGSAGLLEKSRRLGIAEIRSSPRRPFEERTRPEVADADHPTRLRRRHEGKGVVSRGEGPARADATARAAGMSARFVSWSEVLSPEAEACEGEADAPKTPSSGTPERQRAFHAAGPRRHDEGTTAAPSSAVLGRSSRGRGRARPPLRRDGGRNVVVVREDRRDKKDRERRHDRHGRGGGERPDEEREGHQRGDPEQDDPRREEERGWTRRVFQMTMSHMTRGGRRVRGREEEPAQIARQEERHAADRARKVEVDRPSPGGAGRDARSRRWRGTSDDVEETREAGLEAENESVEVDALAPHLDAPAEDLRPASAPFTMSRSPRRRRGG